MSKGILFGSKASSASSQIPSGVSSDSKPAWRTRPRVQSAGRERISSLRTPQRRAASEVPSVEA